MSTLLSLPLLDAHLKSWYYDAGVAKTRNEGSLGGTLQLGDGTTVGTFPTQLVPHGMSFDSGDYITVPNNAALSFGDGAGNDRPFSIEFLTQFGLTWAAGVAQPFFSKGALGVSLEYAFYIDGSNTVFFLLTNPATTAYIARGWPAGAGVLAPQKQVMSWVATYDGSKAVGGLAIYRNAIRVDTTNYTAGAYAGMTAGAANPLLGGYPSAGFGYFTGNIFNAAIYPWALTPSQVAQKYRERMGLLNVY